MPLHIHRSTNPDTLAAEAARLLAEPPADPLALDRIAVHSRGVEQWLAMRIAGHNGIFGAATFFRPDDLTAQLAADALGEPLPATWTPGELLWAMLAELPPLLPQLDAVRDYVDAEGPSERPLRRVTLAQRLAPVFATYGSYRPNLVRSWQHPADDEPWEAPLWRAVEARLGATHRVPPLTTQKVGATAYARVQAIEVPARRASLQPPPSPGALQYDKSHAHPCGYAFARRAPSAQNIRVFQTEETFATHDHQATPTVFATFIGSLPSAPLGRYPPSNFFPSALWRRLTPTFGSSSSARLHQA